MRPSRRWRRGLISHRVPWCAIPSQNSSRLLEGDQQLERRQSSSIVRLDRFRGQFQAARAGSSSALFGECNSTLRRWVLVSMVQERLGEALAVRQPTLTVVARFGFAARGLLYLLVGAFAVAAALGLGQQPHGIMDVLTALIDTRLQTVLAAVIGLGLACLAGYFAIRGLSHCCRGSGARRWLFGAGMLADALIYGAIMISLLSLALGWPPAGPRETQIWTAWALPQPVGRARVGFVRLVTVGFD